MSYYLLRTNIHIDDKINLTEVRIITSKEYDRIKDVKYKNINLNDKNKNIGVNTIEEYLNKTVFTPINYSQANMLSELKLNLFGYNIFDFVMEKIYDKNKEGSC